MIWLWSNIAYLYAMEVTFWQKGFERVLTTAIAVGITQSIKESELPQEIKVPLCCATFTVGAYGIDWHKPVPITNTKSLVLALAGSTLALTGSSRLLTEMNVTARSKATIMTVLYGITLWRFYKANAGTDHDN